LLFDTTREGKQACMTRGVWDMIPERGLCAAGG